MKLQFEEFLAAPECKIMIVAYPDIFQTEAKLKHGKFSREYQDLSAVIMLDSGDLKKIRVKDGDPVKIKSGLADVVVTAKESEEEHPGIGYMPESAWSNVLGVCPVSAKVSRSQQEIPVIDELWVDVFPK
ncbi:MAG: molybdopterin dinucleotide binding domain-containing protein [Euryarchaeota archaeon]|nr:molybdopterin dinucleotide binding domain-containing protein [Euryarchaeota archaeon]